MARLVRGCLTVEYVSRMDDTRSAVFDRLKALGVAYDLYEHPAVFTAEEAATHWKDIPGTPVKNLFLRNKKGDRHYLVILGLEKQADLRQLVRVIGDDRLSFGSPERLMKYLGVTPGSVSPLGLIHDTSRAVRVIVDSDLRSAERLIFHPNDNTASVTLGGADFARFLEQQGNSVKWVKL
jgi:Ala-tRNA(Pro) deacylase